MDSFFISRILSGMISLKLIHLDNWIGSMAVLIDRFPNTGSWLWYVFISFPLLISLTEIDLSTVFMPVGAFLMDYLINVIAVWFVLRLREILIYY